MSKYNNPYAMDIMTATSQPVQKAHWVPKFSFMLPADSQAFVQELKAAPDLDFICTKMGKHRQYIANVECGFDIENTTVDNVVGKKTITDDDGNKVEVDVHEYHGYMYIWQFCFGDFLVKGRRWEDFHWMMAEIQKRYSNLGYTETGKGRRKQSDTRQVLLAIANNTYEFQYLCHQMCNGSHIVKSVFADNVRRPVYFEMDWAGNKKGAFKAIDVLRIGSLSLKSLGEDYCTTQKMKGDLDYNKMRNSKTPLTAEELKYCDNDVIILHEYMTYYLDTFVNKCRLVPVTKTGIVRAAVAHEFLVNKYLVPELVDMFPDTYAEYSTLMTRLYRGGYTHANIVNVGEVIENVHGMDFTSSYPAVMTGADCKYPIKKFQPVTANVSELDTYADDHDCCWYATFEFENLSPTTNHSIESTAKVIECFGGRAEMSSATKLKGIKDNGIVVDNGRVRAADKLTVMLTEQDWEVYRKFYTATSVKVSDMHAAQRGALPEYLTSVVKYFYKKKAELKRQGLSDETAYIVAKQCVNSAYGLCVQSVHVDEIKFDAAGGWVTAHSDTEKKYQEAVHKGQYMYKKDGSFRDPQYWMPPQYGIWITAHARRRILTAIYELGDDCIYSDTDSVYFKNYDAHKQWFDDWNTKMLASNKQIFGNDFDLLGDLGTFDPVEIKWKGDDGKKHCSYEYSFKTWGAKRYIKMDDEGHMEQTIAGLPKGTVLRSVMKAHPEWNEREAAFNCFDIFEGGLELDLDDSNKLTTSYNDEQHSDIVVDEFGNSEIMHETSSVCLYKIPFKMTVDKYYYALWLAIKEESGSNG